MCSGILLFSNILSVYTLDARSICARWMAASVVMTCVSINVWLLFFTCVLMFWVHFSVHHALEFLDGGMAILIRSDGMGPFASVIILIVVVCMHG
jgi:hypothetical protein